MKILPKKQWCLMCGTPVETNEWVCTRACFGSYDAYVVYQIIKRRYS